MKAGLTRKSSPDRWVLTGRASTEPLNGFPEVGEQNVTRGRSPRRPVRLRVRVRFLPAGRQPRQRYDMMKTNAGLLVFLIAFCPSD